jgi:hypothetical protein
MSGSAINAKVQKAYSKLGNKLGYQFAVYRSLDYLNPIQPRNFLKHVNLSFSLDDTFTKQQGYSFDLFDLFADMTTAKKGDIYVNDDLGHRFTLVGNDPIATPKGILSTSRISIYRPVYSTVGGFKPTRTAVFMLVPAQVLSTSSSSATPTTGSITAIKTGNTVQEWDIWTWLPLGSVKPHDVIVDEQGNDMFITSIEPSDLGYKFHCVSTKQ